jgi:outer membrane protein OmpA-like peptidoglycan-associated protein
MSEQKDNSQNKALSDVEKLLLLLSELNIIDSDKSKIPQNQEQIDDLSLIDIKSEELSSNLVKPEQHLSFESSQKSSVRKFLDEDFVNEARSPSVCPFPSLLDELPFLKDIQPVSLNRLEENHDQDLKHENLNISNNSSYLQIEKLEKIESSKEEEIATIDLIQNLFRFGSENTAIEPLLSSPLEDISLEGSSEEDDDDDDAIHMLQNILVVPELEDMRNFKISVEQKLGVIEKQINSPELIDKMNELENLVQYAAIDLSSFESKLTAISNEQINIPTEISSVRDRIGQLEHRIYDPQELVQLLLPIIAELLSLKTNESREEMCQVITPIIAEVISERSQLDNLAMSRAIADILPNAISEQIRNSPDEIAKAIAPEIGAAIREQIRLDRDAIIYALAPEMGAAIKRQIVLERDSMVDALYPVIGNTIAKYFAEAIRSINEKVEQTFSIEGLQRKFRAKMQGVSEAELILKESVPFEVQAIFLIHNLSGLVIIDIQRSKLDSLADPIDSDMMAGMLTAIRSFAGECMSRSESVSELDAINYSGSKILLEVAGYCYLAVIIRGEPDLTFVNKIRDVFGSIVQVYGDRLKEFDGDFSIIPTEAEIELQTLMNIEQSNSSKKSSKTLIFMSLALFMLIFIPVGIYQYQSNRDRQLETKVLEAFASTPELAVYRLNVSTDGDRLKLSGKLPNQYLRDRALQVAIASTKTEIAINKINNNIYTANIPPDPALVAIEVQRLTKALNYTQGVNIQTQFKNGQMTITGQIEQPSMIPKITQTFIKISGITSVNNAAMIIIPKLSTRIYFPLLVTALQPNDAEKLLEVQAFLDMYSDYNIEIFAKTDQIGDRITNYQLGLQRARAVREALLKKGVNAKRLHISETMDTSTQQPSEQFLRWVEFQPKLKSMPVSN